MKVYSIEVERVEEANNLRRATVVGKEGVLHECWVVTVSYVMPCALSLCYQLLSIDVVCVHCERGRTVRVFCGPEWDCLRPIANLAPHLEQAPTRCLCNAGMR